MMKRIIVLLCLVVLLIPFAYSLGIQGPVKITVDYEPGRTYDYDYYLINNDLTEFDYELTPQSYKSAVNLEPYVTITPTEYKNVNPGESRPFHVSITLPDNLQSPGDNEIRIWVKSKAPPTAGSLTGVPNVGIRFMFFVLYPWKTIAWGVSLPPTNIDETEDFKVNVRNLGQPVLDSVKAYIDVFDSQDTLLQNLETNTERNIQPKESRNLNATFDSTGLPSGSYHAHVKLFWDQNVSEKNYTFTIGHKYVKLINFTRLFEFGEINRMNIQVENQWNDPIEKIYAKVQIFDQEGNKVKEFKSLESSLDRLKSEELEAYFDTDGLDIGDYVAKIELIYDGTKTYGEGDIRIDKNINAVVVEEIPGSFNLGKMLASISMTTILTFLLVIFVLLSIFLVFYSYLPKKKKEEEEKKADKEEKDKKTEKVDDSNELDDIDDEVFDRVKELRKKYKDDYIKDMLMSKGWSKEKIEEIYKRLEK